MSHRHPHGRDVPYLAVSDCAAPTTRGTISRMPPHMLEAQRLSSGAEVGKSQLDSGLDSGYLSSQLLTDESVTLSQRSVSPQKSRNDHFQHSVDLSGLCPKQASSSSRLDSGVDVGEGLCQDLTYLRLDERRPMSAEERHRWEVKYVDTLTEAFKGDEDGDTHLHLAIIYRFRKVAEKLIQLVPHQNFINLRNNYLQSPLHLAVLTSDASLVRQLLVAGADPSCRDRHGNTPLHLACLRADRTSVQALTDPVTAKEIQQASLRYSCTHVPIPAALLDQWNYQGLSCLHLAVLSRDVEITAHLFCYGANVQITEGKAGRTSFHLAAETGDIEMLRLLVELCGANMEAVTYGGLTGYQLAWLNGRYDVVELLEALGASKKQLPESDIDSSSDSDSEMLVVSEDVYTDIRIRGQPLVAAQ